MILEGQALWRLKVEAWESWSITNDKKIIPVVQQEILVFFFGDFL
jgi:hypothetical protein